MGSDFDAKASLSMRSENQKITLICGENFKIHPEVYLKFVFLKLWFCK
jgi:hypothetical protein